VNDQQQPIEPAEQGPGEPVELNFSGTVFLMVLLLMGLAGLWLIMYFKLLGR
jgi:hypothetical protein